MRTRCPGRVTIAVDKSPRISGEDESKDYSDPVILAGKGDVLDLGGRVQIDLGDMRRFLSRSLASANKNKVRGVVAEVAFRDYVRSLGYSDRVSPGGWLARTTGSGAFASRTVVVFPEVVQPKTDYPVGRPAPEPPQGLHSVCSTFHAIGVEGFFCYPEVTKLGDSESIQWIAKQLGVPLSPSAAPLAVALAGMTARSRPYNFLRYKADVNSLPDAAVPEEFSKESLRVALQTPFLVEASDVDGVLWGHRHTYPIEMKEKTCASDKRVGPYFGIDIGPFVKLAFYAAKRGNLKSLFVVRESALSIG